jgi:hypothetical protein
MSDEKFEEFLQREAQRYNEPPALVQRDELFAAIAAARRVAMAGPARPAGGARTFRYAWIGMAAALVMGVAIGKFMFTKPDSSARVPLVRADTGGSTSYAQATTAQLARAEALLTAYGAAASDAGVDRQLSTWARDILSNTRLLLDSPAADDPARRRLLQDLELVLVQMVQRSPTAGVEEERSHIDRSLEHTHVLTRLRSALPAGLNN